MSRKFTALVILDGFGYSTNKEGNAIALVDTPNIDALMNEYPHTLIGASGMSVGLPDGQMGNSEVGHLNIGAGRIVYQELTRITKAINDGDFFTNDEFISAIESAKAKGGALHLMGLLSDGGVHSHNTHLYALIKMAKERGLEDIYIHCFMDGRDVPPDSGKKYIEELEAKLSEIGAGKIATVSGRYYSMDRDNRWERVVKAYDAIVNGKGDTAKTAIDCMINSYAKNVLDEFVVPCVIDGAKTINDGDSVIFFNFRPDRAREITRALTQEPFDGFKRDKKDIKYVCMTQYDKTFNNVSIAYKPQTLSNTFGEYIAKNGLKQFRIAETEKYAHVTFFFNGGVEQPNDNEDRVLIPSPKVATYDLQPEMSAYEVCDKACELILSQAYDVMILNFANPDMVGHTGILEAAESAVKAVDKCLGKVVNAIKQINGQIIITADHGNSEQMIDPATGGAFTAHSTNPVPFILVSDDLKDAKLKDTGILADIAPTMLELLDLEIPDEMSGSSMIIK